MILIKNVDCFDGEAIWKGASVLVSGSKILGLFTQGEAPGCSGDRIETTVDGNGGLLAPGYIDLHLHGCGGFDVMDGTPEAIDGIAALLAQNGTTSFLPTTLTMPPEAVQKSLAAVQVCMGRSAGANILGVHLEGPFINKNRKGAQNEKYILEPTVQNYKDLVGGYASVVKRITLAPEVGDGLSLVRYAAGEGVCVSAGHTCAPAETFKAAVEAGVTLSTHLFNGMDPLYHRAPGVVGISLLNDRVYTEFIPDLLHIDADVLRLVYKIKGEDRCVLITDSLPATCLGDGAFQFGGQKVVVRQGVARTESGSLAGSIITLRKAVQNMVGVVGADLKSVLKMATLNPARVIGVDSYKGRIRPGYDADLNLLNRQLDIDMTMVMGRIVANHPGPRG